MPVTDATSAQTGWNGAIVAINAYNTGTGTAQGYEQTLALLPFASNQDSLAESATSTINLDQTDSEGDTVTLYDLIFAQSNNLFPVLETSEMLGFIAPYTYPAISVTSADSSSCANALQFYQNICAFPSSNLAKNFQEAMSGASSDSSSASDIDSSVSTFFASTKDYQNVTLSSYVAVTTYLNTFANAWANFASSYTYYLYQSSGSSPSSGTNTGAKSEGKVTFAQAASTGVPSPTDTSGGYTITYTDSNNNRTTLYFSDGQLVSNTTQDIPLICLQTGYTQLSQFTGQSSDAATLVPMIYGTLNGQQVIGISAKEPTDSNWLLSVENFFNSGGMQLCFQILGIVMGLKMLCDGVAWLKNKFTKDKQENDGDDPTEEQVSADRSELSDVQDGMESDLQSTANRLDQGVEVQSPSELAQAQDDLEGPIEETQLEMQIGAAEDEINFQAEELQDLAEVGVNENMEQAANQDREAMEDLEDIDVSNIAEAEDVVGNAVTLIGEAQGELTDAEAAFSSELSASAKESIEASQQAQEEEEEEQEEAENAEEATESGDDFEEDLEDA